MEIPQIQTSTSRMACISVAAMGADIEILFEDKWLLIVNKPSGLPTQPTVDRQRPSLYSLLLECKKWPYIGLHHRLDVPTSGIVLLTKDKSANKGVSELFQGRDVEKNYLCLVHGLPEKGQFSCENHLKAIKLKNGKTKMVPTLSGGDFAHTDFEVKERYPHSALLRATLHTGRMHQIRTHLATLNFPILGDSLYFRADRKFPRLLLHAFELKFTHPVTGEKMMITAPLPEDFEKAIARVRLTSQ